MSRVVILGAGISGHTAATFARKWLGRDDTVTVVSPDESYNWIPSNIWVGVGLMGPDRAAGLGAVGAAGGCPLARSPGVLSSCLRSSMAP